MACTEEQVLETLPGVRPVLEQIAHKWSILILTFVCEKPQRFNALKRRLDGITQKALTVEHQGDLRDAQERFDGRETR